MPHQSQQQKIGMLHRLHREWFSLNLHCVCGFLVKKISKPRATPNLFALQDAVMQEKICSTVIQMKSAIHHAYIVIDHQSNHRDHSLSWFNNGGTCSPLIWGQQRLYTSAVVCTVFNESSLCRLKTNLFRPHLGPWKWKKYLFLNVSLGALWSSLAYLEKPMY